MLSHSVWYQDKLSRMVSIMFFCSSSSYTVVGEQPACSVVDFVRQLTVEPERTGTNRSTRIATLALK